MANDDSKQKSGGSDQNNSYAAAMSDPNGQLPYQSGQNNKIDLDATNALANKMSQNWSRVGDHKNYQR